MLTFLPTPPVPRWRILILVASLVTFLFILPILFSDMTTSFAILSRRSGKSNKNAPNATEKNASDPKPPIDLTVAGAFGEMPPPSHPIYRTATEGAAQISPLTNEPANIGRILSEVIDLKIRMDRMEANGGE